MPSGLPPGTGTVPAAVKAPVEAFTAKIWISAGNDLRDGTESRVALNANLHTQPRPESRCSQEICAERVTLANDASFCAKVTT
jgi:hypothetical protein